MKTILKVLVGSRLHGLNNEESDYDYRGIFTVPLVDILSPFRKQQNTSWFEDKENHKEDQTIFELVNFSKMAASGNCTILEILWSNQVIEIADEAIKLIENRYKFISKERVYLAGIGYGQNQLKKCSIENPTKDTPKAIIAYIRTMRQTKELLDCGDFNPFYNYSDRDFLMDIKYDFNSKMIPYISKLIYDLRQDLEISYKNSRLPLMPDIRWIEEYLLEIYTKEFKY